MILVVAVGVAGSVGAVSRYLLDGSVQDRTTGEFPFGTLTVNVVGSLILGCVTALAVHFSWGENIETIVGVGFCGALTTWSTASWETVRLLQDGETRLAARYVLVNLAASLCAAGLGYLAVLALSKALS